MVVFVVVDVVVVETSWFQSLLGVANILSSLQIATAKSDLERSEALLSAALHSIGLFDHDHDHECHSTGAVRSECGILPELRAANHSRYTEISLASAGRCEGSLPRSIA